MSVVSLFRFILITMGGVLVAPVALLAAPHDPLPGLPALPLDDFPYAGDGTAPPPPTPYVVPVPTPLPSPTRMQPITLPDARPSPYVVEVPPAAPPVVVAAPDLPLLADQIIATNGAFLRIFAPTAKKVPDGKKILEDAEDLQKAALKFRDALLRHQPKRAEHHFREVVEEWGRVSSKAESVAIRSGIRRSPTLDLIRGTGSVIHQAGPLVGLPAVIVRP